MSRIPFIVGLGGTTRPGSTSEQALGVALEFARARGAETRMFGGRQLLLPLYEPETGAASPEGAELIEALRRADGVIISSPCYHGGISGLVKNAIDYTEEMRSDARVYLDARAVGAIGCGYGFQGPGMVVAQIRQITHALRGWPTPLGVAVNAAVVKFTSGVCSEPAITAQLEIMAGQVVDFARMRIAAEALATT